MKKNILVIGASGFLGTRICYEALQQEFHTTGTFNTHSNIQMVQCRNYELNLRDPLQVKRLFSIIKPDIVILCAGGRDVNYCEQNHEDAYQVHVNGTKFVANACAAHNARMVYISTDAVFSGEKTIYTEKDSPHPINVYGQVKLLAEGSILQAGIDSIIIRTSLLFGWSYTGQGINTVEYVIRNLRQGISIKLPDTLYNTPIYVGTAAKLIIKLSLSNLKGICNLAGKTIINRYELGVQTAKQFNLKKSLIIPTSISTGLRPINSCLCVNKIEKYFNLDMDDVHTGLKFMWDEPEILDGLSSKAQFRDGAPSNIMY